MKRYIALAPVALCATVAVAQSVVDAARFSNTEISGTARYRSMAGAFGALGGDASCMQDNPAGVAIYRGTNVFTLTPHWTYTSSASAGSKGTTSGDNGFALSNLAAVFSFRTESNDYLVNFNLGLGIQRQNEVRSKYRTDLRADASSTFGQYLKNQANNYLGSAHTTPSRAFDWESDTSAPILSMLAYDRYAIWDDVLDPHAVIDPMQGQASDQTLWVDERTRLDRYNISGSFNILDRLYVGATVTIMDFSSIVRTEFAENYSADTYIDYDNSIENKASGIGVNLGVIWKPIDEWRLGFALHTPTWTTMREWGEGYMRTDYDGEWSDYHDSWKYDFYTPWEYQFSTAYVLGTRALLSVEYDLRDYTTMSYKHNRDYGLSDSYFDDVNSAIKRAMQLQHTWKAGLEVRATQQLSVRAGYAYTTSPYTDEAYRGTLSPSATLGDINATYYGITKPNYQTQGAQYYITGGLGWRGTHWFADMSYMYHHLNHQAAAYPDDFARTQPVSISQGEHNWDVTLGYRF